MSDNTQPISDEDRATLIPAVREMLNRLDAPAPTKVWLSVLALDARLTAETAARKAAEARLLVLGNQHWAERAERYRLVQEAKVLDEYMICCHDGEFVKRVDFLALMNERDAAIREAVGYSEIVKACATEVAAIDAYEKARDERDAAIRERDEARATCNRVGDSLAAEVRAEEARANTAESREQAALAELAKEKSSHNWLTFGQVKFERDMATNREQAALAEVGKLRSVLASLDESCDRDGDLTCIEAAANYRCPGCRIHAALAANPEAKPS